MKSMNFGYEASVDSNTAGATMSLPGPIVIRGIQVKVAYVIQHEPQIFGGLVRSRYVENTHAEVLWMVYVTGQPHQSAGPLVVTDSTPGAVENDHGNGGDPGYLAIGIMKTCITVPPTSCQMSDGVVNMGLEISVPAGQSLIMSMGHDGYPGDAEMQGVLFYG